LWPLFLAINELNPRARFSRQNPLLIGIWQGKGKPPFQSYLKGVSSQLNHLYSEGIHMQFDGQDIAVKVKSACGVFDLPAKASVLNMMYFNGQFPCITCEAEGKTVKQGKGYARYYPDRKGHYKLRTHDEVQGCMVQGTVKKPVKGFKGASGLSSIETYSSCGLNMHNTCAHLIHFVKLWGPLWAWSCFSFEDNNAMLLQAVHGTGMVTKQSMWYKQIQATLRSNSLDEVESRAWKITYKANNCDVCGKMVPFESSGIEQDLLEKLGVDEQCVKIIERVSLQGQQFSSSKYARMKKRICSYVLYDDSKVGYIKYFAIVTTSDTVYAVLDMYEVSNDIQFFLIFQLESTYCL
ncbi:hypothetical protein MAR_035425, partial [Mya arenaria]